MDGFATGLAIIATSSVFATGWIVADILNALREIRDELRRINSTDSHAASKEKFERLIDDIWRIQK